MVGWLVGCSRAARRLFACERAGRVFVGDLVGRWRAQCLVGAWWVLVRPWWAVGRITRAPACLREVCGRVGNVEGVAFAQELFGL